MAVDNNFPKSTPVLIVGGGPVGLLQARLLSQHGIQSLIVERYAERLAAPKAHAVNPRTLEIIRQYGLDEKRIRSLGTSRSDGYWVNFITNLSGEAVGRLPYERMDPAVLDDTPEVIHNIPQPALEEEFGRLVRQDPNITLRRGFVIKGISQVANEVHATVQNVSEETFHEVKAQYLIGCDGNKSKVRELMKIPSEGEASEQVMMTIHFNANLRPVVKDRVGMLFWIMDPIAAGFIIGYDLGGNQVHISQIDVTKQPVESWTEDLCREKVRAAIGQDVPFDVLSFRPWIFKRQIASTFQKGNVFLAGDAAHSFPPTGGLGLNCGLADVHNLAYKIALVHEKFANPRVLSSYTTERRSIADVYSKQSVKNGHQIFALVQSLNTAGIEDISQARKNLMEALKDPAQRKKVDDGIEGQREHFDNLELHIGYVYGAESAPPHASHYRAKFLPGARLPHAWISLLGSKYKEIKNLPKEPIDVSYVKEFTDEEVTARQWSTLDLCSPTAWTLIIGEDGPQTRSLQEQFEKARLPLNTWRLGQDFEVIRPENFAQELQNHGLLIRPDQHIMALLTSSTTAEDVVEILHEILGI